MRIAMWAALWLCGCAPKAGDECQKGTGACKDRSTALRCHEGKFIEVGCKGQKGCALTGDKMECDISGAQAGDVCSSDMEGESLCSADGKGVVICKGGKLAIDPCRGPGGCKVAGAVSRCDNSITEAGDPCPGEGYTCNGSATAVLKCTEGKAVVDKPCEGDAKCKIEGSSAFCDGPVPAPPPPVGSD